ncbi:hypothetical protein E4U36_006986 [Claviceps purpurea]|nr:hypothetical protein E4U36_006986 [Claviceps purpurea]
MPKVDDGDGRPVASRHDETDWSTIPRNVGEEKTTSVRKTWPSISRYLQDTTAFLSFSLWRAMEQSEAPSFSAAYQHVFCPEGTWIIHNAFPSVSSFRRTIVCNAIS